jgi:hypothetical protein
MIMKRSDIDEQFERDQLSCTSIVNAGRFLLIAGWFSQLKGLGLQKNSIVL